MKTVTTDPFSIIPLGDRVVIGDSTMSAMKGRIETTDLRQTREARSNRTDRCEIVRLVQRCETDKLFQNRENAFIDNDGAVVIGAAMHNAMTDSNGVIFNCSRSHAPAVWIATETLLTCAASKALSIRTLPSVPRASNRGVVPMPLTCPLIRRCRDETPSVPNTWNFTLEEPELTTRIVSMGSNL